MANIHRQSNGLCRQKNDAYWNPQIIQTNMWYWVPNCCNWQIVAVPMSIHVQSQKGKALSCLVVYRRRPDQKGGPSRLLGMHLVNQIHGIRAMRPSIKAMWSLAWEGSM